MSTMGHSTLLCCTILYIHNQYLKTFAQCTLLNRLVCYFRWLISRRSGSKNSLGMARLALKLLEKLASLQSALEANGEVLQPLPRAHREMTSPEMLPHICQVKIITLNCDTCSWSMLDHLRVLNPNSGCKYLKWLSF